MRVGSIVYFRCSPTESRPAIVTGPGADDDQLDLIVFVHPDDGFELEIAEALFTPDELEKCAAPRRSVKRGDGVGQWTKPNG